MVRSRLDTSAMLQVKNLSSRMLSSNVISVDVLCAKAHGISAQAIVSLQGKNSALGRASTPSWRGRSTRRDHISKKPLGGRDKQILAPDKYVKDLASCKYKLGLMVLLVTG